jgi:tripartite-type tricarboxylate transporter receptor subunit TctC
MAWKLRVVPYRALGPATNDLVAGHADMMPSLKMRTEAADFFREEAQLWGRVIKEANIPMQ